jgi:hypothetical protein
VAAFLLALAEFLAHLAHHGFRPVATFGAAAYLTAALLSVYVSIWRRWDFEIVGWILMAVFFVGIAMS